MMRYSIAVLSALCLLALSPGAWSQSPLPADAPILTSDIDAFIEDLLSDWHSPGGVSVAVVRKTSNTTWQTETKGYGIAKADGSRVTEETLMAIGSNSKLFTVLATGLLVANESLTPRISWRTKIKSVLPQWGLMDPVANDGVSIMDAMSHRTGLPRHDFLPAIEDEVPNLLERLRFLRPSAEFRETFQYTNIMYTVLSYLPTTLLPSHPKFTRFVKANIFDPLGMNSTTYSFDVANRTGNLADGFSRQPTNPPTSPIEPGINRALPFWFQFGGEDGNFVSGPGGVISNAVDMATWLQMLLSEGRHPQSNATVIPADAINMAATGISVLAGSSSLPFLSPLVYGGGQWSGTYRGHSVVEHDGGVTGFISSISRLPFDGIGISVLTNDEILGGSLSQAIKYRLIDQALGLPPLDSKSLYAQGLTQSFENTPTPVPRLPNATLPSGGLAHLAGVYEDKAYGRFELCLASPVNASVSNTSKYCGELLSNVSTILPGAVDPTIPTLLAKWNRPSSVYFRMTHIGGNGFGLSALNSFPTGNASEPFWTQGLDISGPTAEFAQEDGRIGFGVTGGVWGAGEGVPEPTGETVKERSEVWFAKV